VPSAGISTQPNSSPAAISEQIFSQSDAPIAPSGRRNGRSRISPRARRRANELQIDLAALSGSGRSGRIIERDVVAAVARPPFSGLGRHRP
jgi:pyruvate dehydrogenase E2 component (dihydrolipoamide acetyltransferase)